MEPSFKANFVKLAYIKEYSNSAPKNWKRRRVSFVELDTSSVSDMKAINQTAHLYTKSLVNKIDKYGVKEYNYANDLVDIFNHRYVRPTPEKYNRFFAITAQKGDFEILNSEEILGIVQMDKKYGLTELKYLQVDPKENYTSPDRKFKHIGNALIRCIKKVYAKDSIYLYPDDDAIGFYLINKFRKTKKLTLVLRRKNSIT